MRKRILVVLGLIVFDVLIVTQYIIYFSDLVAKNLGYFVAIGLIPFVFGACTGFAHIILLPSNTPVSSFFKKALILLGYGVVSVTPVIYTLLMFLFFG